MPYTYHWKFYNENSKLESEGIYNYGLKDGKWNYYFENGNIERYESYKNDVKDGGWGYYYNNGLEGVTEVWKENELISQNCFKEKNGKKLRCKKSILINNTN